MKRIRVIVERHPDGYVAYPLGLKGIIGGEGDTYEGALADVKPAIRFHIETFGTEVLDTESPVLDAYVPASRNGPLMPRFPVDAPKAKVIKALAAPGFRLVRVHEQYCHAWRKF